MYYIKIANVFIHLSTEYISCANTIYRSKTKWMRSCKGIDATLGFVMSNVCIIVNT